MGLLLLLAWFLDLGARSEGKLELVLAIIAALIVYSILQTISKRIARKKKRAHAR